MDHPEFPDVTTPRCWGRSRPRITDKSQSAWVETEYRLYTDTWSNTVLLVEYAMPRQTKLLTAHVGGSRGSATRQLTHQQLRSLYVRVSWHVLRNKPVVQQDFIRVMGNRPVVFPSLFRAETLFAGK